MFEGVDHALFYRWNVIARHDAAGDFLVEAEARSPRHRFDAQDDVAELAMPARLLLVPAALLDAPADGLAIADRGRMGGDRDAEALRQPFGRDPQVHLPLPPRDHLVG